MFPHNEVFWRTAESLPTRVYANLRRIGKQAALCRGSVSLGRWNPRRKLNPEEDLASGCEGKKGLFPEKSFRFVKRKTHIRDGRRTQANKAKHLLRETMA